MSSDGQSTKGTLRVSLAPSALAAEAKRLGLALAKCLKRANSGAVQATEGQLLRMQRMGRDLRSIEEELTSGTSGGRKPLDIAHELEQFRVALTEFDNLSSKPF